MVTNFFFIWLHPMKSMSKIVHEIQRNRVIFLLRPEFVNVFKIDIRISNHKICWFCCSLNISFLVQEEKNLFMDNAGLIKCHEINVLFGGSACWQLVQNINKFTTAGNALFVHCQMGACEFLFMVDAMSTHVNSWSQHKHAHSKYSQYLGVETWLTKWNAIASKHEGNAKVNADQPPPTTTVIDSQQLSKSSARREKI